MNDFITKDIPENIAGDPKKNKKTNHKKSWGFRALMVLFSGTLLTIMISGTAFFTAAVLDPEKTARFVRVVVLLPSCMEFEKNLGFFSQRDKYSCIHNRTVHTFMARESAIRTARKNTKAMREHYEYSVGLTRKGIGFGRINNDNANLARIILPKIKYTRDGVLTAEGIDERRTPEIHMTKIAWLVPPEESYRAAELERICSDDVCAVLREVWSGAAKIPVVFPKDEAGYVSQKVGDHIDRQFLADQMVDIVYKIGKLGEE